MDVHLNYSCPLVGTSGGHAFLKALVNCVSQALPLLKITPYTFKVFSTRSSDKEGGEVGRQLLCLEGLMEARD